MVIWFFYFFITIEWGIKISSDVFSKTIENAVNKMWEHFLNTFRFFFKFADTLYFKFQFWACLLRVTFGLSRGLRVFCLFILFMGDSFPFMRQLSPNVRKLTLTSWKSSCTPVPNFHLFSLNGGQFPGQEPSLKNKSRTPPSHEICNATYIQGYHLIFAMVWIR